MKTAEVRQIFAALRQEQVDLVRAITRPQVRDDFLRLDYDDQKQWDFGVEVASRFGFNWDAGRQDRSAHPFHHQLRHPGRAHHHAHHRTW